MKLEDSSLFQRWHVALKRLLNRLAGHINIRQKDIFDAIRYGVRVWRPKRTILSQVLIKQNSTLHTLHVVNIVIHTKLQDEAIAFDGPLDSVEKKVWNV